MYGLLLQILFIPLVLAQNILLENGTVTYTEYHRNKKLRYRKFFQILSHIDHHQYPNAVDIKIHADKMPNLHEGSVMNLPKLKILRFPKCSIETIAPQAFKNLPSLTSLYLQDNYLRIIEEGVFNYQPIKELFLQRNEIATIRRGAFDNMPKLVTIKLNSNKLTEWDGNWFRNTPELTHLFFRRNEIREVPARAFANIKPSHNHGEELVDLQIYLSKNRIESVHPDAFHGLDSVFKVWLDRNEITELHKDTFAHLSQLEELYLEKNHLEELHKFAFKNLEILAVLDVSRNNLTCLPFEIANIVDKLIIDGRNIDCDCLWNVQNRLVEEGNDNEIDDGGQCDIKRN